jgi:hypothetical protein
VVETIAIQHRPRDRRTNDHGRRTSCEGEGGGGWWVHAPWLGAGRGPIGGLPCPIPAAHRPPTAAPRPGRLQVAMATRDANVSEEFRPSSIGCSGEGRVRATHPSTCTRGRGWSCSTRCTRPLSCGRGPPCTPWSSHPRCTRTSRSGPGQPRPGWLCYVSYCSSLLAGKDKQRVLQGKAIVAQRNKRTAP